MPESCWKTTAFARPTSASPSPAGVTNRIRPLVGVPYPIVQAPMTYIARAELAAAVSEAGGLGMIER